MKNILILSNFESYSVNATTYAMEFFSGQSCHFYFLNVVKVWEYTTDNLMAASAGETVYDTLLSSSKSKLKKKLTHLEQTYAKENYTFTAIVDYDVFTDAIKQAVKSYAIDCILMGSNGQSNFIERLFGSHSTRVVSKVDCPVFIIPDNYTYSMIHNVLLVLDEKNVYSTYIFDKAFNILDKKAVKVAVLRLSETEPLYKQEEITQIEKDFDQRSVPYFHLSQLTDTKGNQLQIVDEVVHADANVISTRPISFTSRLIKNTGVEELILNIQKPTFFLKD